MSISIALLDDQVLFRKGLKTLLTSFGDIEVQIDADNEEQLIAGLSKKVRVPDICIISSAAFMNNNNKAIRDLKRKFEKMKILVLSAYPQEYALVCLHQLGVNGLLHKNAKPEELKKAVLTTYKRGMYWPKYAATILKNLDGANYPAVKNKESHLRFLQLCLEDFTYEEMSLKTGLSKRTLEGYRDDLFAKFGVNSKSSLVLFAIKNGILELK